MKDNLEFQTLISDFYDLDISKKKDYIAKELEKTKKILDLVLQFKEHEESNILSTKTGDNCSSEEELVKIYHDILIIEEALITYLRDSGY